MITVYVSLVLMLGGIVVLLGMLAYGVFVWAGWQAMVVMIAVLAVVLGVCVGETAAYTPPGRGLAD